MNNKNKKRFLTELLYFVVCNLKAMTQACGLYWEPNSFRLSGLEHYDSSSYDEDV